MQVFEKNPFRTIDFLKRLPTMKLAIRILAFAFVLAGGAAASVSSTTTHALASHQAAAASLPVPICGPDIPCPPNEPIGK